MANGLENLITRTRLMAGLPRSRALNDRQLLERFADGDEAAFTALVDRYGGLVMGVCRRVLQHTQDAEDAFQATFMVLARKAGKVAWNDSIANWLHGVACRISFQIRREKSRRQAREKTPHEPIAQSPDLSWSELKPVLDEELDRLPARYRIPLILCCLEGKSRDEAAAQLGWSVGSVKGRLERGREILRSRLAKRGLTLSAALAATLITTAGAQAAVPLTLGLETVRAGMALSAGHSAGVVSTQVLTLAQGALHAMYIAKLKFAAAVLLTVVTLGLGTGYVTHQVLAGADVPATSAASDFVVQRGERKQLPSVSGFVKSADAAKINILVGRDNPDGETFELVKDVKVVLIEGRETKDAKLADVQPRTRVTLILDDAKKVVQTIQIIGARAPDAGGERLSRGDDTIFRGLLTEIDTTMNTISFVSGGRGEPETTKTFALAKDVKVTLRTGRSSKEGKLSDVVPKTYVQVKLDETKKIVLAIDIAISTTAYGSVSKIDADSITLVAVRAAEGKSQTFALAKDVKVQFRYPGRGPDRAPGKVKEGKLADVMVNALVSVQLDDERKVVQAIDIAVSTTAHGSVSEIDDKSITLVSGRDPELKSETYALAKDVKAQYRLPMPGEGVVKVIKLADVAVKSYVSLQLDDERKTVQSIDIQLPNVRGTVQKIDVKKGTLVIRGGRADDLSVSLAKDLRVIINGKAGKLGEIAVGAEVVVILSPDRMQALFIATPLPEGRREE